MMCVTMWPAQVKNLDHSNLAALLSDPAQGTYNVRMRFYVPLSFVGGGVLLFQN